MSKVHFELCNNRWFLAFWTLIGLRKEVKLAVICSFVSEGGLKRQGQVQYCVVTNEYPKPQLVSKFWWWERCKWERM
jgi:hypothetical protein